MKNKNIKPGQIWIDSENYIGILLEDDKILFPEIGYVEDIKDCVLIKRRFDLEKIYEEFLFALNLNKLMVPYETKKTL